ncbi:pantetheine-phosphate adenylyltransferase [Mycoplasmopsis californica]|uniref:Phosphopantetheine adenylyltransferase n=1 Tax=Mycoplasmopsis equigenitalium TaxID=114883 RepID=A0ABY5J1A8_9BACT|nr:pantetheine-phosphate adenylyltransferase [Mycoplasmopsis equigenitalium]UUD37047.1 pantetheine-phosphate adenylyltransferase [Mycoplasmopsis equigenitalium]VEU69653.1 pantetheine-phosphate adenylyltransferase [Mycoplasmopsis californica]
MKIAIYPGSFDPLHKGHLEIIKKVLKIFDKLIVIVSVNPDKENQTPVDERLKQVCDQLKGFKNVEVIPNKNKLIGHIARDLGVEFIIRSARNKTDFDYELELAAGNNHVNEKLETILIMPDFEYIEYSSTLERHKKKLGVK